MLKWNLAPWLYVPRTKEIIKYEKATKHISNVTKKVPESDIKDRLAKHNAGVRDHMALDGEDKELIVPPLSQWFHETGFHLSPGGQVAIAGLQIALRKFGDIGQIRRENKEFILDLHEEISVLLERYENEFKPMLDAMKKQQEAEAIKITQQPAKPPEPNKTKK
mgnify:FL=1